MKFDMQRVKYAIGFFLFAALCQISILHAISLSDAVKTVRQMKAQGKTRSEIANYVNQVVDNRIIALNRNTNDESRLLGSQQYDMWLKNCEDFSGNYGATSDKLIVTDVSGNSNIQVGQSMKMMPAGVFQVKQKKNEVTVVFRGSEFSGTAIGRLAILNDVVKGNTIYANLTKVKINGKVKLKVVMKIKNPNSGAIITREGILTKV